MRHASHCLTGDIAYFTEEKLVGCQERVRDALHDRAVCFGLGALAVPFRIGLEGVPLLLAVGERLPFQQIIERLVRMPTSDGPEAGLLDAVPLPDLQA